jgi:beta-galactosidase
VEQNGRRAEHGNRQQGSPVSPRYREFCRRITAEMAKRFGHNPNIIGWQIDNEYGVFSWDDATHCQFQKWLQDKYETLDNLNQHWTTEYWSQTYSDWSQIPMGPGGNPGLDLEFRRFRTESIRDYQHVQVAEIRAHSDPRQFITSNFMGWYDAFDHYELNQELDLASWDDYIGTGHLDALNNGMTHDLTRGFKRKNFWVMETQPGFVNWAGVNNALNRGEVRAMAWHDVGHGADAVSYWQWRSARNGREQYHGTLIGADGTPVPLYDEVAQIGAEFERAASALASTSPRSEVAILHSYDSRWAINSQRHNRNFDPVRLIFSYYKPLREILQQVDILSADAPLEPYKLVVAPGLNVLPNELAQRLTAYVNHGGHLVLGPRSGLKDRYNALAAARQPGPLVPLLGRRVEQFYALDEEVAVSGSLGSGKARIWAEQLAAQAPDVEVPLTYGPSNGWLDQQPAMLTRAMGKGRITYLGAWLDDDLMRKVASWMIGLGGLKPAFGQVPDSVEASRRVGDGKEVFILVNHGRRPQPVALPRPMRLVLQEGQATDQVRLAPYGVGVLESRYTRRRGRRSIDQIEMQDACALIVSIEDADRSRINLDPMIEIQGYAGVVQDRGTNHVAMADHRHDGIRMRLTDAFQFRHHACLGLQHQLAAGRGCSRAVKVEALPGWVRIEVGHRPTRKLPEIDLAQPFAHLDPETESLSRRSGGLECTIERTAVDGRDVPPHQSIRKRSGLGPALLTERNARQPPGDRSTDVIVVCVTDQEQSSQLAILPWPRPLG